ncbi:MAG: hypothetical protein ACOY5F_20175 [Pseudomonadota bacterium]
MNLRNVRRRNFARTGDPPALTAGIKVKSSLFCALARLAKSEVTLDNGLDPGV